MFTKEDGDSSGLQIFLKYKRAANAILSSQGVGVAAEEESIRRENC